MTYYTGQHQYYCGVDLHARTMYLCIVNQADDILYHKEIPTKAEVFLEFYEQKQFEKNYDILYQNPQMVRLESFSKTPSS